MTKVLLAERRWVMPNKYTFAMPFVKELLTKKVGEFETWVDPFAGKNSPAQIRNDADESNPAEYHLDGLDFLKLQAPESMDGVLFDPPYSTEQALRIYKPKHNGTAGRAEYWARCRDEIARIVKVGGYVISFGWDSCGTGNNRGFEIEEVHLLCHGACHNDTIITIDKKIKSLPATERG